MKNNYIKNFLTIGLGTAISMIIGFLTTPIITRIVGTTTYGQYSIFICQYRGNDIVYGIRSRNNAFLFQR